MKFFILVIIISCTYLETCAQNEGVNLVFDRPNGYAVAEAQGALTVCLEVEGSQVMSEFQATLSFTGISAIGDVDFSGSPVDHTFMPNDATMICTNIAVFDDNLLEAVEFFSVDLSASDASVSIPRSTVLVIIQNSDNVMIELDSATYTTEEGLPTEVCASIVGDVTLAPGARVDFTLELTPLTAGTLDYFGSVIEVQILEINSMSPRCVNVATQEDMLIESTEEFQVRIPNSPFVIGGGQSSVFITDDDGATVVLDTTQQTVAEGNSGVSDSSVCVTLIDVKTQLDRDVILVLNTVAEIADENDYVPLVGNLLIIPAQSAVNQVVCAAYQVRGDDIRETDETFSISFATENENDIISGGTSVTITIPDDGDLRADCGPLPDPENGDVSIVPDTTQGSEATYSCSIGHELVMGMSTRICLATGVWSGDEPMCVFVNCGAPPSLTSPLNGDVEFMDTIFLSTATYSCDTGYRLMGPIVRECQANGMWSGGTSPPFCQIVNCDILLDPLNGDVDLDLGSTTFGSTATYECDSGYTLSGAVQRTCEDSGSWQPAEPTCPPVECPVLPNPPNGEVMVTDRTFMNIATYSCNTGFLRVGVAFRTCQADATWSNTEPECIVLCEDLDDPVNGQVQQLENFQGATAEYSCNEGFNLDGANSVRTCTSAGIWSPAAPTCSIVDCFGLPAPDDGTIDIDATTFGSEATFSCNEGFSLSGAESRICGPDGLWSGIVTSCIIVECEERLFNPQNGNLELNSEGEFGSIATYSCFPGFDLVNGDSMRTCQSNGEWTGEAPTCQIVDCGALMTPTNGILTFTSGTTFRSVVVYQCNTGHDLVGLGNGFTRECQASGVWTESDPTCEPVVCEVLPNPMDGQVTTPNGRTFMNVAEYVCDEGHNLVGEANRICEADEEWSGVAPTCIPVTCGDLQDPLNGQVSLNSDTFDSQALYTCNTGYMRNGNRLRRCLATAVWSGEAPTCPPVDCGPLEDPVSGMVTLGETTFQHEATYSCDVGYNLVGSSPIRTCLANAIWSGIAPTCEIVDCGPNFGTLGNGTVDDEEGTTFGSQVEFTCNRGFTRLGNQFRECLANGSWSGSVPTCQMIVCPDLNLSLPPFTTVTIDRISPDSTVLLATYECAQGYKTMDLLRRVCDPMGSMEGVWSGVPPNCTIVDCGPPSEVTPGSVDVGETVFGSIARYECDQGFLLEPLDSRTRECQADGTWFGVDPLCQLVDCGPLFDPPNGIVQLSGTLLESVATYSCFDGFKLLNEDDRTCGADGQWTGIEGICRDINECMVGGDADCHERADCNNTEGSFACTCTTGYTGNGTFCEEVDECLTETDNCDEQAECENTEGSFECTCRSGFVGTGVQCEETCSVTIQIVLEGVNECNEWRFIDAPEKLADIDSFVQSSIASRCGCTFTADNIFNSVFSCPRSLPSSAVVYQSDVRGVGSDNCGSLVGNLDSAIDSSPSLLVLGNQLDLREDCDVRVSSEDFTCTANEESSGDSEGINLIMIAGAAVGGALLVALLLIICMAVVVSWRKQRNRRSRMTTASSFVHVNTNASYGGSRALPLLPSQTLPTPKDHAYARPDYFSMNKTQTTPFSTATEIVPGRLIKTRYTDMKMDLKSRKPVLQPGQMDDEDFYQQVHDDDYDRPRSISTDLMGRPEGMKRVYTDGYDRPRSMNIDLRGETHDGYNRPPSMNIDLRDLRGETEGGKQIHTDGYDRPRSINFQLSAEDSGSGSVGSASTTTSKVTDDIQVVASFLGTLPPPKPTQKNDDVNTNTNFYDQLMKKI